MMEQRVYEYGCADPECSESHYFVDEDIDGWLEEHHIKDLSKYNLERLANKMHREWSADILLLPPPVELLIKALTERSK